MTNDLFPTKIKPKCHPNHWEMKDYVVCLHKINLMKSSFIMFVLIVFSVYAIGNVYLFVRGWQSLEIIGQRRVWFAAVFWIVALSFIIPMMLRMQGVSGALFDVLFVVGSFWIAVMLYGFLALITIDLLRIIAWAGSIKPDFIHQNYPLSKIIILGIFSFVITVILCAGYHRAHHPQITRLEIEVDKQAGQLPALRVVMASDIHLGQILGRKSLARIVNTINEQHPDLVLFAGDTFDGSPAQIIKNDMGAEFDRLQTKYGAYAVSGNHEYIGERETPQAVNITFDYLSSHGVQALQDAVILIDSSFYLAGRKDRTVGKRKTLHELLAGIDRQLPVIMMDHQPFQLDEVEQAGIDLHLSGHTHHGQMWPLNYITRKIYEQDWGFLQKGQSKFYVSCGAGTWGPPIRTAGHSEVVVIDLKFN